MKKILAAALAASIAVTCLSCSGGNKDNSSSSDGGVNTNFTAPEVYKPVWLGDTVYEESIVIVEGEDGVKTGTLLYEPTEILRVNDYTLTKTYDKSEYRVDGKTFIATDSSTMPYFTYDQYYNANVDELIGIQQMTGNVDGKQILFTESAGLVKYHVNVTYKHADKWQGKVSEYQGDKLPKTVKKLTEDKALTMFMTGDSIAAGCNSSALFNIEPYRPSFGTGFALELEDQFKAQVDFTNGAVGGWTSQNGSDHIDEQMVEGYAPDLAIIAFGMNDGSFFVPNSAFEGNIRDMIERIRKNSPDCEFILIATILGNPDWVGANGTQGNYLEVLNTIAADTDGCAVLDMTSFTAELYKHKRGMDMLANNVNHPSDFLQRCYIAQLMTTVCESYK